jgi:hypothetical protein
MPLVFWPDVFCKKFARRFGYQHIGDRFRRYAMVVVLSPGFESNAQILAAHINADNAAAIFYRLHIVYPSP